MEKEVPESALRFNVRKKYLEKIMYALGKDSEQHELYAMVRGFFSEFLKLEYEFTYEELSADLNKIFIKPAAKKQIDEFLYELSESEYLFDRELEQQEIKDYLNRFKTIVETLISDTAEDNKRLSFFEKIFKKDNGIKPVINDIPNLPDKAAIIENDETIPEIIIPEITLSKEPITQEQSENVMLSDPRLTVNNEEVEKMTEAAKSEMFMPITDKVMIEDEDSDIVNIRELMEESYFNVNYRNFEGAKGRYLTALEVYHKLSVEDKRKVYMQLYELFEKLKSMN